MIPVTQTKTNIKKTDGETVQFGNCMASVIASILELPLSDVPNFEIWYKYDDYIWYHLVNRFLIREGYQLITNDKFRVFHNTEEEWLNNNDNWEQPLHKHGNYYELKEKLKGQYYLVSGISPRNISHITIWQDGKMVHDPHPSREGLLALRHFEQIIPLSEEDKKDVETHHINVRFPQLPSKKHENW